MVSLVPCTEKDYPLFAELFTHLETGDETPSAELFCRELLPEARVIRADGIGPAGYLISQVLDGVGYIRQIVIRPEHRGRGLARAALVHRGTELRAAGCRSWCLNVRGDNRPAVALYTSLGMAREYGSVALRIAWAAVDALPKPPDADSLRSGGIPPEHDAAIEQGFGLVPGTLAFWRASDKALCAVRTGGEPDGESDDGEVVAVAVFAPSFPGAFPFRARRPELAQPLLAAMRAHARPGDLEVHLVIEGDEALAQHLVAAGAVVKLRFDHYSGAIPEVEDGPEPEPEPAGAR